MGKGTQVTSWNGCYSVRRRAAKASGFSAVSKSERVGVPEPQNLLDYEASAEKLDCTPRLVRKLVETRQLASVKVGRLVRIEPSAIQEFIDHHRRGAVK
jgi:excisionase family DNA binding protein